MTIGTSARKLCWDRGVVVIGVIMKIRSIAMIEQVSLYRACYHQSGSLLEMGVHRALRCTRRMDAYIGGSAGVLGHHRANGSYGTTAKTYEVVKKATVIVPSKLATAYNHMSRDVLYVLSISVYK